MKQHITVKQIEELNDKQLDTLLTWWPKKKGDLFTYKDLSSPLILAWEDQYQDGGFSMKKMPLLSIGQMIEFIFNNGYFPEIINTNWCGSCEHKFMVKLSEKKKFLEVELCDALWEAVKEIL